MTDFANEVKDRIASYPDETDMIKAAADFLQASTQPKY